MAASKVNSHRNMLLVLAIEGILKYQNKIDRRVVHFVNLEQIWHLTGKLFFQKWNSFSKRKNFC